LDEGGRLLMKAANTCRRWIAGGAAGLGLLFVIWSTVAFARGGTVTVGTTMILPLMMAMALAPIVGFQIAETHEAPLAWLGGIAVLATVAVSAALSRFGALVMPLPQIIVLALALRHALRKKAHPLGEWPSYQR
jgi:hypothetical protein